MSDIKRVLDKLDEMSDKQDKLNETHSEMKIDLSEVRKDLNYHIKRTDMLEQYYKELAAEIKPLNQRYQQMNGILKALGIIALLAGILASIAKII